MTSKIIWYFSVWVAFIKSKVDGNVSRKTSLVKDEAFDSQNTKPYVTV